MALSLSIVSLVLALFWSGTLAADAQVNVTLEHNNLIAMDFMSIPDLRCPTQPI